MFRNRVLLVLLATCIFVGLHPLRGQSRAGHPLHIDIPVKLEKVTVVFDIGHAVYAGDMPFVIGDLILLASDYHNGNTKGHIVAVLHGDAAISY